MNRIITQFPNSNNVRPLKKARNNATNIIVDKDGTLSVQTYQGQTSQVIPGQSYAVYTTKVSLTPTQIQSLNSTPVTIIPAPPSNQFIQCLGATYYLSGITSHPYSANTNLVLQKDSVSTPVFTLSIADTSGSTGSVFRTCPAYSAGTGTTNLAPGMPLNLWCSTGNPIGGTGSVLSVYVTYKINNL